MMVPQSNKKIGLETTVIILPVELNRGHLYINVRTAANHPNILV
jgi:hypothetical protein